MAPILGFLISSRSKKKEPRYICLNEAKASLRLKILMTSGSKKETQIYYSFLSKFPANEPPSGSPKGPLWRGRLAYRAFCISLKISSVGFPIKGALPEAPSTEPFERAMPHSQSPFIQLSKSPVDVPSSRFPKRSPYEKRCPFSEPFLNILQGARQGSPPSRFPSHSSHRQTDTPPPEPLSTISQSPSR